jgi:hypothetical protein
MRPSLLKSVIVTEFQATEAYSSLQLTKAKHSTGLRWKKEMLLCELAQVISVHVERENRYDDENVINIHIRILNTVWSQFKGTSKCVLPGKRDDSNFTGVRRHKICRTPFLYTNNI